MLVASRGAPVCLQWRSTLSAHLLASIMPERDSSDESPVPLRRESTGSTSPQSRGGTRRVSMENGTPSKRSQGSEARSPLV